MSKPGTRKPSRTDWAKVDALTDEEIDYSEIPEQDAAFFATATLRMPQPKATVTLRLDQDLLEWLKAQGKGYQTRINAILRAYMEAQNTRVLSRRTPRQGENRQSVARHPASVQGVQRDTIRSDTVRKRRTSYGKDALTDEKDATLR